MDVFVARQPVFNRHMEVVAYELLLSSAGGLLADESGSIDFAVLSSIDLADFTNQKRAIIQFDNALLVGELAAKLPRNLLSVVIPQGPNKDEIKQTSEKLKDLGYLVIQTTDGLATDMEALENADIIMVDFSIVKGAQRNIPNKISQSRTEFLAKNVETMDDFLQAVSLGYTLMQGGFYIQPSLAAKRDLSVSRTNYLRIFSELTKSDIDFDRLEAVIQHDVAFCYKLLKFINSASFGFKEQIRSIKQALVLLGKNEVMYWVASLTLHEAASNKPQELITLSVARAKFGEMLAVNTGLRSRASDVFLLGMFSLIDALLDRPLDEVLSELPLAADIKEALQGGSNQLRELYEAINAYENGRWSDFNSYVKKCGLTVEAVPEVYFKAIHWADNFVRM